MLSGADGDPEIVTVLGGPHALGFVQGEHRTDQRYWLRVWAARGLLWAWDDAALDVLCRGMTDDAWRVREMCCKVVARHELGEALAAVVELRDDPVERVRRAAGRAVVLLTSAGA
jgi:HEAT repeat protein